MLINKQPPSGGSDNIIYNILSQLLSNVQLSTLKSLVQINLD